MSGRARVVLLALLGLGATLRLWTIGEGLPYLPSVDEAIIFARVAEMVKTGDLHPHLFDYGGFIYYFHLAIAWLRVGVGSLTGSMPPAAQVAASDFYLWSRIATALLGTGIIYIVFRAASRWGLGVGLLAAAAIAVHPQLVQSAHLALTDTPLVFAVALTLLLALRAAELGTPSAYAWAGVAAGLATGIKYPGGLAGLMPLAALFTTLPPQRWLVPALALFGAALAAFALAAPYTFIDFEGFRAGVANLQTYYNRPSEFLTQTDLYRKYMQAWFTWPGRLSRDYGLPAMLVAGVGLLAIATGIRARDGRARAAILLPFPIAYLIFIANQSLAFGRYAMPLIPFVAIGLAAGMVRIYDVVARRAPAAGSILRPALLLLFVPLLLTAVFANRDREPTGTLEQMTAWMERTVRPDEPTVVERQLFTVDFPARRFKVREVERLTDELEKYRDEGVVYLIWINRRPDDIAVDNPLLRISQIVERFTPAPGVPDPTVWVLRVLR